MNALTLAVLAVSFAIMYHDLEIDEVSSVLAAIYWVCWISLVVASLILVVP